MLSYVYVAIGGAIGSVARAWVSNVAVRLVGADFPWGTILINIVGSFIIGIFAALSVNDSRFQLSTDLRTFLMVGICGGFTTFSSFSLQTLDLLRDGRPGAALANIGVSVILCLLAVAAGYASATAIAVGEPVRSDARASAKPTFQGAIGGRALAVLDSPETATTLLACAERAVAGGQIEALAVRPFPIAEMIIADQPIIASEEQILREREHAWAEAIRAKVEGWKSPDASTAVDFIEEEGDMAPFVSRYGRHCDVVVVRGAAETRRARDGVHAALFTTARPVLVVPPQQKPDFGHMIAIAWKDDDRASKAVLAAMPFLKSADAVHVLRANVDEARMPRILEENGVVAKVHAIASQPSVGACLLKEAHDLGADLLLMGAYTHGEWREAVFGGVTRFMLDHADLPILMAH